MSVFIQNIPANQCIGDSLLTINANFSSLETGLLSILDFSETNGVRLFSEENGFNKNITKLATTNSYVQVKDFDFESGIVSETISLPDGTTIPVKTFPYVSSQGSPKPYATFTVVAPNGNAPQATIYWMGSGVDPLTVYALNSAQSFSNKGQIWFDDSVHALYKLNNTLYVGGSFLSAGNVLNQKFAVIDLNGGSTIGSLGKTGSVSSNLLSSNGGLGSEGSVDVITLSGSFLSVGGSFNSTNNGKGLSIVNTSTGTIYSYEVNGKVTTLHTNDRYLYVGGSFDSIKYKANTYSVPANSLCRIDLNLIRLGFPNSSIDENYCTLVSRMFSGSASVNSINSKNSTIYIGGDFNPSSNLLSRNLLVLSSNGQPYQSQHSSISSSVSDILIDGNYLYCSGSFGCKAYNITDPTILVYINDWLPVFDGPVIKTTIKNSADEYLYVYGRFTTINQQPANFIGAIKKASVVGSTGEYVSWHCNLETGPYLDNKAFLHDASSKIFVGGNFTRINNSRRFYLGSVSDVQTTTALSLSSVVWDFGGQIVSNGMNVSADFTNSSIIRLSSFPETHLNVTTTKLLPLKEGTKGIQQGQAIKFFVRRPGNSAASNNLTSTDDTYKKNVNLLNITLNFDLK